MICEARIILEQVTGPLIPRLTISLAASAMRLSFQLVLAAFRILNSIAFPTSAYYGGEIMSSFSAGSGVVAAVSGAKG